MDLYSLGPNGATLYCLAHLLANIDWLQDALQPYHDAYLIVDCPGQVETFTCQGAFTQLVELLQKQFRLCVVNLVDAHYCSDGAKFISVVMVSLKSMFMLGLPQINVLSKIDLVESYGELGRSNVVSY
jgi:GPN-loop GTPase